ncbi:glycoside hydrolase family 2 protein [Eisenbergiella sp.]
MRVIKELKQNWKYVKIANSPQEAYIKEGSAVILPHTWNAVDGQDGGNDYYRGTCWYVTELDKPEIKKGGRVYLEFLGAAVIADVYLNGEKMGHHEGGYSTFRIDLTDKLKEQNIIAIALDNSDNNYVYPRKADFTFYGGLYRMVNLITVEEMHFDLDYAGGDGIKVTPEVVCDEGGVPTGEVKVIVETWVKGKTKEVKVTIMDHERALQSQIVNAFNGKATAVFVIERAHLWNGIKDPYLYSAKAEILTFDVINDCVETRFGCRSFYADPKRGFVLNGKVYPLRGVSRHQDRAGVGNALSYEMHKEDMELIKEIGANTIRLAHYQHAKEFYDLCDEYGMVVWAEIPYITMHLKNGRANSLCQMKELVVQNYNHPSIVCWGLSNEITAATPINEDLLENHRLLNDLCHRLDTTRFTTMAHVFMQEVDSPLLEIPDVNSYNLYFGWYLGELKQNDEFFDDYHKKFPDRVIGFSEYGADANPQYHNTHPKNGDYSETYQMVYHEHILEMIEKRPFLWSTYVWNMFDFAADGRDEGGKHGVNQKGLVTFDRKIKKDAFYLYKAYWNKDNAFVHICEKRYTERTEKITEIKVYSNQPVVALYVDDNIFETKQGYKIFRFAVPITGKHRIIAKTGTFTDEVTVCKVLDANPDYVMGEVKGVVNWFDDEPYKPECYSIKDKISELKKSPEAGEIVSQITAQGAAARGDVAESVKDNPNLVRMMERITLENMLGHMSDRISQEQVKGFNRALQQIKKEQ